MNGTKAMWITLATLCTVAALAGCAQQSGGLGGAALPQPASDNSASQQVAAEPETNTPDTSAAQPVEAESAISDTKSSSIDDLSKPDDPTGLTAVAHCFCRAGPVDANGLKEYPGTACIDWGQIWTYTGLFPQSDKNRDDCKARCSKTALADSRFTAAWLCPNCMPPAYAPFTGYAYANAKVGTREWDTAQTANAKCCVKPAVVTCPAGWLPDTNGPGLNKCKRQACTLPGPPPPLPANGTAIGTWGFTWGNAIWQWGPSVTYTPPIGIPCQ